MTKEGAPQPHGWQIARRYDNPDDALAAYRRARDLLFSQDLDATTFRILLEGQPYVALIGEAPLTEAATTAMEEAFGTGEPAELPSDVVDQLGARRAQVVRPGLGYLEIQHGPGTRIQRAMHEGTGEQD